MILIYLYFSVEKDWQLNFSRLFQRIKTEPQSRDQIMLIGCMHFKHIISS